MAALSRVRKMARMVFLTWGLMISVWAGECLCGIPADRKNDVVVLPDYSVINEKGEKIPDECYVVDKEGKIVHSGYYFADGEDASEPLGGRPEKKANPVPAQPPVKAESQTENAVRPPSEIELRKQARKKGAGDFDETRKIRWHGTPGGYPDRLSGTVYGFYPFWMAGKKQDINFSALSRIGYFSLSPDAKGNIANRLHWKTQQDEFIKVAHRHGTKVDLVISYYDWERDGHPYLSEIPLYVRKLRDNIVSLVRECKGDGVTIDFDGIQKYRHFTEGFKLFIYLLNKELKEADHHYYLNIMLPRDAIGKHVFSPENLKALEPHTDLFLVTGGPEPEEILTLQNQIIGSKEIGPEDKDRLLRKIVPVVPLREMEQPEATYAAVREPFGGIGVWPVGGPNEEGWDPGLEVLKAAFQDESPDSASEETRSEMDERKKKVEEKDALEKIKWHGSPCGCCVITEKETVYGFYPFWMAGDEQMLDFSTLSRIGYFALPLDENGKIKDYKHWTERHGSFTEIAHKYNTRADLVISYYDWGSNPLKLKDSLLITDGIAGLFDEIRGDGVTLDFDGIQNAKEISRKEFENFISDLKQELKKKNDECFLNLMFSQSAIGKGILTMENLIEFANYENDNENITDLFLIVTDSLDDRFELLEKIHNTPYDSEKTKNLLRKTVPVIMPADLNNATNEEAAQEQDAYIFFEDNFGGVGLWPVPTSPEAGDCENILKATFESEGCEVDRIKALIRDEFPQLCRFICPNRLIFRIIIGLMILIPLLYGLLCLWFCELNTLSEKYFWFFWGYAVFTVSFLYLWLLCDPWGKQKRTEIGICLIFIIVIAWIIYIMRQRRKANFP